MIIFHLYTIQTLTVMQYFICDQSVAVTFHYQNITHMCLFQPEHPDVRLITSGSCKYQNKEDNKNEITYS